MGFSLHSEWKWGLSTQHTRTQHFLEKIFSILNILELKEVSKLLWKCILFTVGGTEINPHSSVIFSNFSVCGSFAVKGYESISQGHLLWPLFLLWFVFQSLVNSLWIDFRCCISQQHPASVLSSVERHFSVSLCVSSGGNLALFIDLISPALCLVLLALFKKTGCCH